MYADGSDLNPSIPQNTDTAATRLVDCSDGRSQAFLANNDPLEALLGTAAVHTRLRKLDDRGAQSEDIPQSATGEHWQSATDGGVPADTVARDAEANLRNADSTIGTEEE